VWARGPRPNAPVRSINTVSVARVRPSGKGLAQFDGAHPVNGAGRVEVDAVSRVGAEAAGGAGQPHLALAMAALAEQVAQQAKRQATMERHLADLGKVLGQLGLEVDERLGMVEHILDKLTAPNEQQRP
jgi:predicted ribonuclease YlaK